MKKIYIISHLVFITSIANLFGQPDTLLLDNPILYGTTAGAYLAGTYVAAGNAFATDENGGRGSETLSQNEVGRLFVRIPAFTPETGTDTDHDTVSVVIRILFDQLTAGNSFDIHSEFTPTVNVSDIDTDGDGSQSIYLTFKFTENRHDTIFVTNVSSTSTPRVRLISAAGNSVNETISNITTDLNSTDVVIGPNPVSDYLKIELPFSTRLSLSTLSGERIKFFDIKENYAHTFSLSELEKGVYFLNDMSNGSSKKIIIQ